MQSMLDSDVFEDRKMIRRAQKLLNSLQVKKIKQDSDIFRHRRRSNLLVIRVQFIA